MSIVSLHTHTYHFLIGTILEGIILYIPAAERLSNKHAAKIAEHITTLFGAYISTRSLDHRM